MGGTEAVVGGGGDGAGRLSSSAFFFRHVLRFSLQCMVYMLISGTAFSVSSSRGFAKVDMKKIWPLAIWSGSFEDMTVVCSCSSSSS